MCSFIVTYDTLSHLLMFLFYLLVHTVGYWKTRIPSNRSWKLLLQHSAWPREGS